MKKYLAITAALALTLTACFRPFRLLVPPCFTRSLP